MQSPVQLNGLQLPKDIEITPKHYEIAVDDVEKDSFADMLSNAINGVDTTMKTSESKMQDYVSGKTDNVADVMISMQRAQLSFQMMVEVRNKAIETYNEISRMQI
ncbi:MULTISPECIES: flagellar hook-basal body complex protein FliE [Gracilimonas]|uniref:Flagellar hook-basal body complex protein FliE n=1 Tax=Gracilimonas sediminicola TaxID=2952158 RepID=A0A9X2RH14_9BACT|nr:flagellar hook-basal body complex protein FliE [Gracilimonas sediminicola]MCP9291898.1 flagellar hook-basal body complex protein FliE [Gracilimonas sediminicola]